MKVNEIFFSIQGESTFAGLPCVFIRLTGCNLRCRYCDTTYAYDDGFEATIDEVVTQVLKYNCQLVEITGGEPLLQAETPALAQRLIEQGLQVLVETNGTLNIDVLPASVIRIMDIKCPGSGESDRTDWANIHRLRNQDEVKFVLTNRVDFDWAVSIVREYELLDKAVILFSPAFVLLNDTELANWILDTRLPIRLQIQLHKYILIH